MIAKQRKIFVLDTNVLIHDPTAIRRFQEHDVYLPIVVLEELDKAKVGLSEVARNVRQVSRFIDELVENANGEIGSGVKIPSVTSAIATGKLHFHMAAVHSVLPDGMDLQRPASLILTATSSWYPRILTCASRRTRSACTPKTTPPIRFSTTPTCCTPA